MGEAEQELQRGRLRVRLRFLRNAGENLLRSALLSVQTEQHGQRLRGSRFVAQNLEQSGFGLPRFSTCQQRPRASDSAHRQARGLLQGAVGKLQRFAWVAFA